MLTRIFGNSPNISSPRKLLTLLKKMMQSIIKKFVTYIAARFFNLYNFVSYNNADMEVLKTDIDDMINTQCTQSNHCTHGTHSIISSDVLSAIRNLKHDKNDGDF